LGITLLVLEILVLPGLIAGLIGGLFIVAAITWTFSEYGTAAGIYTSLATVIVAIIAIYTGLKSKVWKRFSLKQDMHESRVNIIDSNVVKAGDEAITISALRPMGTILIGDQKVEAQTNGELIPGNTRVIIISVLQNKVLVKEA
jgi:membrane-bound serine protease (ClpP class)